MKKAAEWVTEEELKFFGEKWDIVGNNVKFASALEGTNVEATFELLVEKMFENWKRMNVKNKEEDDDSDSGGEIRVTKNKKKKKETDDTLHQGERVKVSDPDGSKNCCIIG